MFSKIRNSLRLTAEELIFKVTWPTWDKLQSSAIIVLVASLIIALVVFVMDSFAENLFRVVYQFFQ